MVVRFFRCSPSDNRNNSRTKPIAISRSGWVPMRREGERRCVSVCGNDITKAKLVGSIVGGRPDVDRTHVGGRVFILFVHVLGVMSDR